MSDSPKENFIPDDEQAEPAEQLSEQDETPLLARHKGVPGLDGDITAEEAKRIRKERLLKNLEKGRKTALENRKRRAMFKKLEQEERHDKMDADIKRKLLEKKSAAEANDEILQLREELSRLKISGGAKLLPVKEEEVKEEEEVIKEEAEEVIIKQEVEDLMPLPAVHLPEPVPSPEPVVLSTFLPPPW